MAHAGTCRCRECAARMGRSGGRAKAAATHFKRWIAAREFNSDARRAGTQLPTVQTQKENR